MAKRRDDETLLVFDPAGLSKSQRAGGACVVCRKAWPRPIVVVGQLPDLRTVYACGDCATGFAPVTEPVYVELDSRQARVRSRRRVLPRSHWHVTN